MQVRRTATVVAFALLPALLAGCGSGGGGATSSSAGGGGDPRPAALVQVENNSAARPQWGLQQASVVYEYVTEGGISRFSAIYASPPSGRVGPVRSARLVTIRLARMYGAVIVYSGASTAVQKALDDSGLPKADEASSQGALFRIGGRPVPHNLLTDGTHLATLLDTFRGRAQAPPTLWPRNGTPPAGGNAVTRVTVPVSDSEKPVFTWDAGAGGWRRSEPDTDGFADAASDQPLSVATLIVQQVPITETQDVEDVNGAHGVDITVDSGSGPAQVFTAGHEYDATWKQPQSGVPTFTVNGGGGAAPIANGLVWICLVATGSSATAS